MVHKTFIGSVGYACDFFVVYDTSLSFCFFRFLRLGVTKSETEMFGVSMIVTVC